MMNLQLLPAYVAEAPPQGQCSQPQTITSSRIRRKLTGELQNEEEIAKGTSQIWINRAAKVGISFIDFRLNRYILHSHHTSCCVFWLECLNQHTPLSLSVLISHSAQCILCFSFCSLHSHPFFDKSFHRMFVSFVWDAHFRWSYLCTHCFVIR